MMLQRSRSKDRSNEVPRPTYMSPTQTAEYLNDLRSNRVPRPNGSRPLPVSSTSRRAAPTLARSAEAQAITSPSPFSPSSQAVSPSLQHSDTEADRETASAIPNTTSPRPERGGRPLVKQPSFGGTTSICPTPTTEIPPIQYMESGQRWMERQEAHSLRRALQDMDLREEQRLHSVAQDEASELVWKHQNPGAPYSYREHLLKGSHTRSMSSSGPYPKSQMNALRNRSRDSSTSGSVSGGSNSNMSQNSRSSSNSSIKVPEIPELQSKNVSAPDIVKEGGNIVRKNSAEVEEKALDESQTMSSDRTAEMHAPQEAVQTTVNPSNHSTETQECPREPAKASGTRPSLFQNRRNPFSRVQLARDGLSRSSTEPLFGSKRFDRIEIQRNPPSQARNPAYTSNSQPGTPPAPEKLIDDVNRLEDPNLRLKNGKEIRNEEIRAATTMKLKDRSPKLPTPTIVSDSPGRPIVSFQADWKPREIELKEEVSAVSRPGLEGTLDQHQSSAVNVKEHQAHPIPTINFPDSPTIKIDEAQPEISIPSINISEVAAPIAENTPCMPGIPSIIVQDTPSIAISAPEGAESSTQSSGRPLPNPKKLASRPHPRHAVTAPAGTRPHWTPSVRRTTALCSHCALPIAGRIVSAAGTRFHPECFVCYHCGEGLECVAFYPEPENRRAERVDRIRRRMQGEDVEIREGESEEDDGDESLRFYCHLDFHEFFSPRCKNCKTPIEGEVIVACGADWHVGHFFCAQCGDPFDSTTPFVEKEGYAWCVNCHTNRYSTKCKKCRRPVTDTVVKALGAEWHSSCFCCVECSGPFDDGRYFLRAGSQDPVCVRCEEKRLKA